MEAIQEGKLCSDIWSLSLTLSQGMDDGSSHGTRTYELSVGDGAVKAQCFGTEWQRGEGSDSWSGASFCFVKGRANEAEGDLYEFIGEFKDAIHDEDYAFGISLNDESLARVPADEPGDSEGERCAKSLVRRFIGDLQEMQDTLFGDDSGLENVWDEICVQKQVEESYGWEVYEITVRALIGGSVEEMPHEQKVVLWLLTPEGESWKDENESDDEKPSPDAGDIENYLFDRLMSIASDYVNDRIIQYRDRPRD